MKRTTLKLRINILLVLLLLIHLVLLIKTMFTAWPEMIAWPYLILNGWLPYRDIAVAHTPILLTILAVFNKIFGVGIEQLKLFTWIMILMSDFLIYRITKELWDKKTAVIALFIYIPLQILYEGNGLWFDLALVPLVLFIYYSLKRKKYLWVGVWFGLAVATKQTAIWLALPIIIFTLQGENLKALRKHLTDTVIGIFIPITTVFLLLFIFGLHTYFYRWAVEFGIFYLPRVEGQILLPTLRQLAISVFPFVILTPLIYWKDKMNKDIIVWSLFAGMGVYPRFELFHFQPALPFLAIGAALIIIRALDNKNKYFKAVILLYIAIIFLFLGRFIYKNWQKEDRFFGQNEKNITSFIKGSVLTDEKIYVVNYWDSIYAMTDTQPATKPLIPYLPWYLEYENAKDLIVGDLKIDAPELIVKGDFRKDGLGSYSIPELETFVDRYYTLVYKKGNVGIYGLNK